jgi:hypothetical protein
MYLTIKEKLTVLPPNTELPLELIINQYGLNQYIFIGPNKKTYIKNIEKIIFKKFIPDKNQVITLVFDSKSQTWEQFCMFDDDFFNERKIIKDYDLTHFSLLKPGSLAYLGDYQTTLARSVNELVKTRAGYGHDSGVLTYLTEGEVVCVLETHSLDTVKLVKILYKDMVYWSYGVFYDANHLKTHSNDQHYLLP